MSQEDTDSRFDRLSREILDGSLPYGLSPGRPPPPRFAVAFTHDVVPSAMMIFATREDRCVEVAVSIQKLPSRVVDQVLEDARRFAQESLAGDEGEMLPFSVLPRRVAIRKLRRLLNAH